MRRVLVETSVALAWAFVMFFTTPASAQAPENAPPAAPQTNNDRYRDGMVIWETPSDAKLPFLLKFNINTQLRYLNTQNSDETFTDHLGVTRDEVRMRVGTAFTRSREDRFSNLDQSSPENTSMYNSDGVLTFSTGAFAPGVTVNEATYRMWAVDGGIKWNGLAINGQYFVRWIIVAQRRALPHPSSAL